MSSLTASAVLARHQNRVISEAVSALGLTKRELCAKLGFPVTMLSTSSRETNPVKYDRLIKIAAYLELSAAQLWPEPVDVLAQLEGRE